MCFRRWLPILSLLILHLLPIRVPGEEIPVVDTGRIDQFKRDLKKIIEDIRWAIGIYEDVKGSYQQLDKLLGDVYREINGLIEGEALEILGDALKGDCREIILSGDYFKHYISGELEKLIQGVMSTDAFFSDGSSGSPGPEENLYLNNPRLRKRYDEVASLKKELAGAAKEALEVLQQVQRLQELIEKDSELKIMEQIAGRHGAGGLEKASGKSINSDSFWAVYGISEYKRMIKLFGSYAILEQKRKEALHRELLTARGYAMQLEEDW